MSSVQRLKERGGAGVKITALKPHNGLVECRHKDVAVGSSKMSIGKEIPRSTSRGKAPPPSQKPAIRPVPIQRIDKTSAISTKESGSYARWSTSSLPKGKAADSSNFARILSDMRTGRLSRASGSDGLEKPLAKPSAEASFKDKNLKDFRPLARFREQKGYSSSNSRAWDEKRGNRPNVLEVRRNKVYLDTGLKEVLKNDVVGISDCKNKDVFDLNREKSDESRSYGVMAPDSCKQISFLGSNFEKNDSDFSLDETGEKDTKSLGVVESGPALKSLGSMDRFSSNNGRIMGEAENHCIGVTTMNLVDEKHVKDSELLESAKQLSVVSNLVGSGSEASTVAEVSENLEALVSINLNPEGLVGNSFKGLSVSDNFREQKCSGECKAVQVSNKYPSRLREKLAFLEGKVNKIASEIKRTKDLLDQNNPDASKLILTDIQDKIAGIEKAMGHMMDDSKTKLVISDNVENAKSLFSLIENNNSGMVDSTSTSVNGLKAEELEARLFPYHKLLRSRAQIGSLRGKDKSCLPSDVGLYGGTDVDDKLLIPADENPIALEFLASLEKKQSKVKTSNKDVPIECSTVKAMNFNCAESSKGEDISRKVMSEIPGKGEELTTDENFEEFDNQEYNPSMLFQEESEDSSGDLLFEIGTKPSTGGWFVSEGASVLLVHSDNTCSFYDITNLEEKAEYKTPAGLSHNLWGDCWLIRAPSSDGCTGRYVVAASAGNGLDSGFCSWDFYSKDIQAFRVENGTSSFGSSSRTVFGSLSNRDVNRRSALSTIVVSKNQQWWYKPCGPLLVSTASSQKVVSIYDIRDGDLVMKWETSKPVLMMEYSSPLHWRSRGKVVLAETEGISLWDVGSLNPQALLSLDLFGKRITALQVNNTDAELGGGVRQRVSSSEVEGNDGVFCTNETVNVLDFRLPSGVGLKLSKNGATNCSSIFSCGDSIFLGVTNTRLKHNMCSQVQQFSMRKGKLMSTYALPEANTHAHHSCLTQVWGHSQFVMGVCGLGLFVFDTSKDVGIPCFSVNHENTRYVRQVIGPDNLYSPSFDYLASRVLVISRDRPALWRYLS